MCGTGPPHARWFLVVLVLIVTGLVNCSSVNRTIDDVHGDSVTGDLVQYLPEVPTSDGPLWFNQTTCSNCADVPDASLTFDHTWSAAKYLADIGSLSVSMKFTGTAIYVFFVLPNFAADSGLASAVLCDFFIDGVAVGSFTHQSDGSGAFAYNSLVYQNTSIPAGDHVLLIETTGSDPAVIIFDFALYTENIPDPPSSAPPPSSSSPPPPSPTNVAPPPPPSDTTDSPEPTSQIPSPSTHVDTAPLFPTSPGTTSPSSLATSTAPFLVPGPGLTTTSDSPPSTAPASDNATNTGASQRSTSVIAIIGAVVGAVVVVVLALLFIMLYRRRKAQRAATGTISVFDLLDDSPPPSIQPSLQPQPSSQHPPNSSQQNSPSPSTEPSTPRRRPLPIPPMSEQYGGRSIGATQTKTSIPHTPTAFAGPSGSQNFGGPSGSGYHSTQSSMSSYSDAGARSDLHIRIPMTSFRPAYSPGTATGTHTPTNSQSHSYSHSHNHSHGHSPITRNGVPMPPEQADIVRGLVLGSLAVNTDMGSIHRGHGSEGSIYTPSSETGIEDDELWGPPVVHVDSGIRISRALMELPPEYAAA